MTKNVLLALLVALLPALNAFSAGLHSPAARNASCARSPAARAEQGAAADARVEPSVGATELREQLAAGGASAGLVRCKFPMVENKVEVRPLADELAELADAQVVQIIGHTALFFRRTEHNRAFFDRHAA